VDCFEVFVHMADQKDPHVEKAKAGIVRLQQVISRLPQPLPPGAKRDPAAGLKLVADGDKQRAAKQMAKAEKAYRDALVADPLCHDAAFNLAQMLKPKNMPEALKMLTRAASIEPVRQNTLLDCAQTAIVLKQYSDAAHMLDRVIARWPNAAPAYFCMALVRQAEGHATDARVYADQYVRLAPPGPERDRNEAWAKTLPQ
jgi:tetratricopeptide (TPR) repeat protein